MLRQFSGFQEMGLLFSKSAHLVPSSLLVVGYDGFGGGSLERDSRS